MPIKPEGGMHTMPRRDPRFTGVDFVRLFETRLQSRDKRLVMLWFVSMIPIKEPKADVLSMILDTASLIPGIGSVAKLFEIAASTASILREILDLLGFEFNEEDVEIEKLRLELENAREDFKECRAELLLVQVLLDNQYERASALLDTISLLQDVDVGGGSPTNVVPELPQAIRSDVYVSIERIRLLAFTIIDVLFTVPAFEGGGTIRDAANDIQATAIRLLGEENA